ncbi:hypothetical protein C6A85_07845, partial [Mycobacterium sp. ITM-2017-0098]
MVSGGRKRSTLPNVPQDSTITPDWCAAAHQSGVIVLSCGTFGNVLRFLPPLTISDELLLEGLDILE